MIQETHWPFSNEWTTDQHHCIHSGTGQRRGGLLCLISKRLCHQHQISWVDLIPGRLVHIRLHGTTHHIDILHVYQHTGVAGHMDDRADLWMKLQTCIQSCPKRNTFILLGDFNTSLSLKSTSVGLPTFRGIAGRKSGSVHLDDLQLHNILKTTGLIALNTWDTRLGATFVNGTHESRIDFICSKHTHADMTAKSVIYLDTFPLLPDSGPRHLPLMTTIRKTWMPFTPRSTPGWTRQQRLDLHRQWLRGTEQCQQIQNTLLQHLQHLHSLPELDLTDLHLRFNTITPSSSTSRPTPLYTYIAGPCKTLHYHTKLLRSLHTTTLRDLFRGWRHVIKKDQARQLMRDGAKTARKLRLQKIYDAANAAERAHDHFRLYEAIRKIAPKTVHKRITLRSDNGEVLTPMQSADKLQEWFQDFYHADPLISSHASCSWPFTQEEYAAAIQELPGDKALAPDCAPAPCWKLVSDELSETLHPHFDKWCQDARLPTQWGTGTLTFLVKPNKRGTHPNELRPIALLEPTGKIMMGLIARRILNEAWHHLCQLPQFAYLPGRGCNEAIIRLADHCRAIRELTADLQYPIHNLAAGRASAELSGGLLISLDMSKAFDTVPRQKLFDSLHQIGISSEIIHILYMVYQHTKYEFHHRGEHRQFDTYKGIRQGCKAAPILWCIVASSLLSNMATAASWTWVLRCVTMYADDLAIHQMFEDVSSFESCLHKIGMVLDVLENFGLVLNTEKSMLLCKLLGTRVAAVSKRFLKRTKQGLFVVIPRKNGHTTLIRTVSQIAYLGVTLSYANFEMATMQTRLRSGERAQHQLHKWLHGQTGLMVRQKLKIWKQCVLPCLMYGLFPIGLTTPSIRRFLSTCMIHIRRIFKEPVYITRQNHLDFLTAKRLQHPLVMLHGRGLKMVKNRALSCTHLHTDDILHLQDPDRILHELNIITHFLHHPENSGLAVHHCSMCNSGFESTAALRRHQTQVHGYRGEPLRQVSPTDACNGVPTCARCGLVFTTWYNFRYHVQYVCQTDRAQDEDLASHEHRARVAELLQYAAASDIQALARQPDLCAHFAHYCVICGQFCVSARGYLLHCNTEHPDLYSKHGPVHDSLLRSHPSISPCGLCGQEFQQQHQCIIVRQLAMLKVQQQHEDTTAPSTTTSAKTLKCPHCDKVYTSKQGLTLHLRQYHRAVTADSSDHTLHQQFQLTVDEAVMQDTCASLLNQEPILELLSRRCHGCQKTFPMKQYLTRHLRVHHSTDRAQMETEAHILAQQLCEPKQCYCRPPNKHHRHLCVPFLQFALARVNHLRGQGVPEADLSARAVPAVDTVDDCPSSLEIMALGHTVPTQTNTTPDMIVKLLLSFGHTGLLAEDRHLRTALTLSCMLCEFQSSKPEDLIEHLQTDHSDALQAGEPFLGILRWGIFQTMGCICNPSGSWGDETHRCVSLTQLTMIVGQMGTLVVPWLFRATDVVGILSSLLDTTTLKEITLALITRQFSHLGANVILQEALNTKCVICRSSFDLDSFMVHFQEYHADFGPGPRLIFQQIVHLQWPLHPDFAFHIAVLLSMPVWHRQFEDSWHWPSVDQVLNFKHIRNLQQSQFIAPTSKMPIHKCFIAEIGLLLLDDPWLAEQLNHTCLSCSRFFLQPHLFVKHLLDEHDAYTYATQYIHDVLLEIARQPCYFCGQAQHTQACQHRCPPALNVAALLGSHGQRRHEPDARNLERSSHAGSVSQHDQPGQFECSANAVTRPQTSGPTWQETQRSPPGLRGWPATTAACSDVQHGQAPSSPRKQFEPDGLREGICSSYGFGAGINCGGVAPTIPALAQDGGQGSPAAPPPRQPHGDPPASEIADIATVPAHRRPMAGLPEIPADQRQGRHALPEMGSGPETVGPREGQGQTSGRDRFALAGHVATDGRTTDNLAVPRPDQTRWQQGRADKTGAVAVDDLGQTH